MQIEKKITKAGKATQGSANQSQPSRTQTSPITKQISKHAEKTQPIVEKSGASKQINLSFALPQLSKRLGTPTNHS